MEDPYWMSVHTEIHCGEDLSSIARELALPMTREAISSMSVPIPERERQSHIDMRSMLSLRSPRCPEDVRNAFLSMFEQYDASCPSHYTEVPNSNGKGRFYRIPYEHQSEWDVSYASVYSGHPRTPGSEKTSDCASEGYAIARVPEMVFVAEAMGLCDIESVIGHGAGIAAFWCFSPSYIEHNEDNMRREQELSSKSMKFFDEREFPGLFDVSFVGDGYAHPMIKVNSYDVPLGVYAATIMSTARFSNTAPSSVASNIERLFNDRTEGWISSESDFMYPALILPSDSSEVRAFVLGIADKERFCIGPRISLDTPYVPEIMRVLARRAEIMPSIFLALLKRYMERRISPTEDAEVESAELLANMSIKEDLSSIRNLVKSVYEEENVESVLDAIASGVPIDDVLI